MRPPRPTSLAALALALALSLCACSAGPDMPMEVSVDGHALILGRTTMADLAGWGYEASLAGRQEVAHEGDRYIYFHYSISRGGDALFQVTAYTLFYGGPNINREAGEAARSGVVAAVTLPGGAAAVYNGVELEDMSFDTARQWGARESSDGAWELAAARGTLRFEAEDSSGGELRSLRVSLNLNEFEAMQEE